MAIEPLSDAQAFDLQAELDRIDRKQRQLREERPRPLGPIWLFVMATAVVGAGFFAAGMVFAHFFLP